MNTLNYFTVLLILVSCNKQDENRNSNLIPNDSTQLQEKKKNIETKDTLFYYYQNDYTEVRFDTLIDDIHYFMKFYCLNDSAVFNETFTDRRKENKNLIELGVAHNYAADFLVKRNGHEYQANLTKHNFKDSLPDEFLHISTIWKNQFDYINEKTPVFRATIAKPDTDYQYAVVYALLEDGKLELIRVEDESYNGSEEE